MTVTRDDDRGRLLLNEIDRAFGSPRKEIYMIDPGDPQSARHEIVLSLDFSRGDWRVRTETRTVMRSTRDRFLIEATLDAFEGSARVFSKNWQRSIPRDH